MNVRLSANNCHCSALVVGQIALQTQQGKLKQDVRIW
jgi:hypothetical protein